MMAQADEFADLGITCVWLPPPTDSVSPQGYMPGDLYNLNSKYGSQEDLKRLVLLLPRCKQNVPNTVAVHVATLLLI